MNSKLIERIDGKIDSYLDAIGKRTREDSLQVSEIILNLAKARESLAKGSVSEEQKTVTF